MFLEELDQLVGLGQANKVENIRRLHEHKTIVVKLVESVLRI
jgi:hypothetical protein